MLPLALGLLLTAQPAQLLPGWQDPAPARLPGVLEGPAQARLLRVDVPVRVFEPGRFLWSCALHEEAGPLPRPVEIERELSVGRHTLPLWLPRPEQPGRAQLRCSGTGSRLDVEVQWLEQPGLPSQVRRTAAHGSRFVELRHTLQQAQSVTFELLEPAGPSVVLQARPGRPLRLPLPALPSGAHQLRWALRGEALPARALQIDLTLERPLWMRLLLALGAALVGVLGARFLRWRREGEELRAQLAEIERLERSLTDDNPGLRQRLTASHALLADQLGGWARPAGSHSWRSWFADLQLLARVARRKDGLWRTHIAPGATRSMRARVGRRLVEVDRLLAQQHLEPLSQALDEALAAASAEARRPERPPVQRCVERCTELGPETWLGGLLARLVEQYRDEPRELDAGLAAIELLQRAGERLEREAPSFRERLAARLLRAPEVALEQVEQRYLFPTARRRLRERLAQAELRLRGPTRIWLGQPAVWTLTSGRDAVDLDWLFRRGIQWSWSLTDRRGRLCAQGGGRAPSWTAGVSRPGRFHLRVAGELDGLSLVVEHELSAHRDPLARRRAGELLMAACGVVGLALSAAWARPVWLTQPGWGALGDVLGLVGATLGVAGWMRRS